MKSFSRLGAAPLLVCLRPMLTTVTQMLWNLACFGISSRWPCGLHYEAQLSWRVELYYHAIPPVLVISSQMDNLFCHGSLRRLPILPPPCLTVLAKQGEVITQGWQTAQEHF